MEALHIVRKNPTNNFDAGDIWVKLQKRGKCELDLILSFHQ